MMQTKAVTLKALKINGFPESPGHGKPITTGPIAATALRTVAILGITTLLSSAAVIGSSTIAQAEPIENWQYDQQRNQLSFVLPDGIKPRYFIMAQPARIVLDIPDTQVGNVPLEQEFTGTVKRISVSQLQPKLMRVILEMSPNAVFGRGQVKLDNVGDFGLPSKDQWVITPILKRDAQPEARLPIPPKSQPSADRPAPIANPTPAPSIADPATPLGKDSGKDVPKIIAPPTPQLKAASSTAASPIAVEPPVVPAIPAKTVTREPEQGPAMALPESVPTEIEQQPAQSPIAQPPVIQTPIAQRPSRIAKPEPKPAEIPPGMASVVTAPPTPPTIAPATVKPNRRTAIKSPNLPTNVPPPPPLVATTQAEPTQAESAQREPERVPVMQLPTAPPIARPPSATIAATASIPSAPQPNGPAASVMPTPVSRPDLTLPALPPIGPSPVSGPSAMVSVPPLATISTATISTAAPATTMPTILPVPPIDSAANGQSSSAGLPPLPPLAMGATSLSAPLSTALPPNPPTLPIAPTPQSVASQLPPLPPVAPRDVIRNQAPNQPRSNAVVPQSIALSDALPNGAFGLMPPTPITPMVRPSSGVIVFGQPLPSVGGNIGNPINIDGPIATTSGIQALDNITTGGITLPAGNVLSLRYDRLQMLKLKPGERQQEILVLQTPIVDRTGQVVVPQGSLVLGDFETDQAGSRFTAKVLSTSRYNLSILAQSNLLQPSRQVSNRAVLQNSGIGALAGAIVGGLGGTFFGGAAAGAAITYAISPRETMIQPGQVVEVRLVQDFLASR